MQTAAAYRAELITELLTPMAKHCHTSTPMCLDESISMTLVGSSIRKLLQCVSLHQGHQQVHATTLVLHSV
jgi:hypothetical protein